MPLRRRIGLLAVLSLACEMALADGIFQNSYDAVPQAARRQFEHASRIWERYLDTDVPIRVRVSWVERGPTAFALPRGVRNAPHLPVANAGQAPRLAPGNVAHFSVDDNPPGSGNYLMTPSSGDGRFSHEPGPLLLAVLQDLGWTLRIP